VKKTALGMVVAGLALATSAFAQAGGPPAVKGATLVIEDFDSYPSDAALAKAWYVPPHGNWMRQTLAARPAGTGGHALKFEYRAEPGKGKFYAAICIEGACRGAEVSRVRPSWRGPRATRCARGRPGWRWSAT
jgi:hypothetical protein